MHYDHVHWKDLYFNKWDLMNSVVDWFLFYFIINLLSFIYLIIIYLFICYHLFFILFFEIL